MADLPQLTAWRDALKGAEAATRVRALIKAHAGA